MGRIDRDRATLYRQGVSGCNALGVLSLYTLYSQSERVWRTENGRESSSTLLGGSFKMCACLRTTLYGFVQNYVTVAHTHGAARTGRRSALQQGRGVGDVGTGPNSRTEQNTPTTHTPQSVSESPTTHRAPSPRQLQMVAGFTFHAWPANDSSLRTSGSQSASPSCSNELTVASYL